MGKLEGKVALVTGAASGNGRGIALRFAAEGAAVAIGDIDERGIEETARLVRERGVRVSSRRCDVSRKADVDALVEAAAAELGRLDVAVANAGVVEHETDCLRISEAEWSRTIGVNLTGVFFTLQAAANRMIAEGHGGRLIAVASVMAEWGAAGTPAYCASKGGVKQLVRSFALGCGRHGITCNAIGPGIIETGMTRTITDDPSVTAFFLDRTPVGRIGKPEDVAAVAAFLASDEASFVTGTILFPDGGLTAGMYSEAATAVLAAAATEGARRGS